jgi:hypothetical protein
MSFSIAEKLDIIQSFLRTRFPAARIVPGAVFQDPHFEIQLRSELWILTISGDFLQDIPAPGIFDHLSMWGVAEAIESSRGVRVLLTAKGVEVVGPLP